MTSIVEVVRFGADPTGRLDSALAIADALAAASEIPGPTVLRFAPGIYHVFPEDAPRRDLFVSNTVGADLRYVEKTIGVLIEGQLDLTIEGDGAKILFHGPQTAFAIIDSRDVTIAGLAFDYVTPRVVDATVARAGVTDDGHAWREIALPRDARFRVEDDRVVWLGEDGADGQPYWSGVDAMQYTQVHDPVAQRTWRANDPLFDDVATIQPLSRDRLRIAYTSTAMPTDVGLVYQMRTTERDHPGVLIWQSERVVLRDLDVHFLHGFGVVGQLSRDLTVERVRFRADPQTGRTSAGSADFINLSSMAGSVRILDCVFDGSHDDAINIHGTYLEVTARPAPDVLELTYRHPETAGLPAFYPGDEIELIERDSLDSLSAASAIVREVAGPSGRDATADLYKIRVTLDRDLPARVVPEAWAAENVTYTPSVTISGNRFVNVPTRGVLVATRRPIVIEGNIFDAMTMHSILVSSDATLWFESGPVRDLTIRGNEFLRPSCPAIAIAPTNAVLDPDRPVHRGIAVVDNLFAGTRLPVVSARSVRGLTVSGNRVEGLRSIDPGELVDAVACSEVVVQGNIAAG
jgi:hypothetical protein